MILWFIVGFIVWALCILFMLAIFKGGRTTHGYEREVYFRYMENTRKARNPVGGVAKETASVLYS